MLSSTSWLPAGPVTARIFPFDANACATWTACGLLPASCVSPRTKAIFSLWFLFHVFFAKFAQSHCGAPSVAAGPVSG